MTQCFYLDTRGRRCPRDAQQGMPFCWDHDPEATREPVSVRRMEFRLAALLLLIVFLVPLFYGAYRLLREALN